MSQFSLEQLQDHLSNAAEALGRDTDLTFRSMFGGITGYYQGRVFASLSNIGLALKLLLSAQEELLQIEGAKRLQYEPDSPPSKQSIVVPDEMLADTTKLADWVKQSTDYVSTLPAPKPKIKKQPQNKGAMMKLSGLAVAMTAFCLGPTFANAQTTKKPPVKKPIKAQDVTQKQGQMAGGDGVFGTVYTLNDGFNFVILSARYSIEPFNTYEDEIAKADEKFLILTVAVKNANPTDAFFNPEAETFTAVDDKEQNYPGHNYRLVSKGIEGFGPNLKPGQGAGQDPTKDELTVAIKVPAKARISKIILNRGRKLVAKEEVVRYFVADVAEKKRDGQDGNPKNVIKPLPAELRDPADKQGAVALTEGIAKLGVPVASGYFAVQCDAVTLSTTEKLNGMEPEEGKQFVIATMTIKNLYGKDITLFEMGSDENPVLKDGDGEKYKPVADSGFRKAKRDEQAENNTKMAPGESYSFRYFFQIPKDAKPKTLLFGQNGAHIYTLDVSAAK